MGRRPIRTSPCCQLHHRRIRLCQAWFIPQECSRYISYLEVLLMSRISKDVYRFGSDVVDADGNRPMAEILGGKGAGLVEMTRLSIPVPPGFTIITDICRFYLEHGTVPPHLPPQIARSLRWLENSAGKRFGGRVLRMTPISRADRHNPAIGPL